LRLEMNYQEQDLDVNTKPQPPIITQENDTMAMMGCCRRTQGLYLYVVTSSSTIIQRAADAHDVAW
jgi:hypothetical protein